MKPSPSAFVFALFALMALSAGAPAAAQTVQIEQTTQIAENTEPAGFPDAPSALAGTGSVHGQAVYTDGSPVSAADITLTPAIGPALRATTGQDGAYAFANVPAGDFILCATANSLEPATATGTVNASIDLALSPVTLKVAALIQHVNAITQEQAAEIEVQQEEHQRLFGAIPNFFVSYEPNPVPLDAKQKYRLSLRTLFDPANVVVSAVIAGGEEASRSYSGFGNGAPGYARRFGANFTDGATGIMLTNAVFPSLLHQDPRYFYKGGTSVRARIANVLRQSIEQRGDNGNWQFAWSNTLGTAGSALISNTYYPNQNDKWLTLTGENFGLSFAGNGVSNFLQEFVFSRVTTHRQP